MNSTSVSKNEVAMKERAAKRGAGALANLLSPGAMGQSVRLPLQLRHL
jgi:hypothetical protein